MDSIWLFIFASVRLQALSFECCAFLHTKPRVRYIPLSLIGVSSKAFLRVAQPPRSPGRLLFAQGVWRGLLSLAWDLPSR